MTAVFSATDFHEIVLKSGYLRALYFDGPGLQ